MDASARELYLGFGAWEQLVANKPAGSAQSSPIDRYARYVEVQHHVGWVEQSLSLGEVLSTISLLAGFVAVGAGLPPR